MTDIQEMKEAGGVTVEQVQALLAELPGKASREVMLDWPCEGQVSLVWWDTTPEQVERDNLHHFDGFDFRVLHDDADTNAPIWKLLRQALPLAAAYLATAEALARAERELGRVRDGERQLREYFTALAERDDHEQAQDAYRHAAEMVAAALAAAPEGEVG